MTKFVVYTETFEYNHRKYSCAEEAYFAGRDCDPKQIALCDTLEEARVVLNGLKVVSCVTTGFGGNSFTQATVAYIEEADWELNDDGEWEFICDAELYYHAGQLYDCLSLKL